MSLFFSSASLSNPLQTNQKRTNNIQKFVPWNQFLFLSIFSGFAILSLEIVWLRILVILMGNRSYVTSIALFLLLSSLGLAAALSKRLNNLFSFKKTVSLCLFLALFSLSLGLSLQSPTTFMYRGVEIGIINCVLYGVFIFLIPAICLGTIFPLTIRMTYFSKDKNKVGYLFGFNTLFSVMGSILTGFFLISYLGTSKIILLQCILIFLALMVVIKTDLFHGRKKDLVALGAWNSLLSFLLFFPNSFADCS